jgi:hypothetical protein
MRSTLCWEWAEQRHSLDEGEPTGNGHWEFVTNSQGFRLYEDFHLEMPAGVFWGVVVANVAEKRRTPLSREDSARVGTDNVNAVRSEIPAGECQESCVRGRFSHHALTNLSSNMIANWVLASHHSRPFTERLILATARLLRPLRPGPAKHQLQCAR